MIYFKLIQTYSNSFCTLKHSCKMFGPLYVVFDSFTCVHDDSISWLSVSYLFLIFAYFVSVAHATLLPPFLSFFNPSKIEQDQDFSRLVVHTLCLAQLNSCNGNLRLTLVHGRLRLTRVSW